MNIYLKESNVSLTLSNNDQSDLQHGLITNNIQYVRAVKKNTMCRIIAREIATIMIVYIVRYFQKFG